MLLDTTRLDKLEERFTSIEIKVNTIENKVDKVLIALTGDDFKTSEGLINEVKNLKKKLTEQEEKLSQETKIREKQIAEFEKLKIKVIWGVLGWAVAGGLGIFQLLKLI